MDIGIRGYFSNNFIVVPAHKTAQDTMELIRNIAPEYIIVSRLHRKNDKQSQHIHYVFLSEIFEKYYQIRTQRADRKNTLESFLTLHEYDGDSVVEVASKNPDPSDFQVSELIKKFRGTKNLISLSNDGQIVGVFDPQRTKLDATYSIKGAGFTQTRTRPTADRTRSIKTGKERRIEENHSRSTRSDTLTKGIDLKKGFMRTVRYAYSKSDSVPLSKTENTTETNNSNTDTTDWANITSAYPDEPMVFRGINTDRSVQGTIPFGTPNVKVRQSVEKYATATLDKSLEIGKPHTFEVIMKGKKPSDGIYEKVVIPAPKGETKAELVVIAKCDPPEIAEIQGENFQTTTIQLDDSDSEPIIFLIIPKKEGTCKVKAQFFFKGQYLGQISVNARIGKKTEPGRSASEPMQFKMDFQSSGPDLSIHIIEKNVSPLEYDILVISNKLGYPLKKFGPIKFRENAEEKFRAIFKSIEDLNARGYDPVETERKIKAKGKLLYQELFPKNLQEFFWDNRKKIQSIQVISEEPWIPWEIIKPWKKTVEAGFLCEDHVFSRWITNESVRQKSEIKSIKVVQPKDTNLLGAVEEARWIENFTKRNKLKFSKDSSSDEVMKSLAKGGFDLLHFTTHGIYNKEFANMSKIILENGSSLEPEDVTGLAQAFGKSNPLVILNACQTGQQGFDLTGIGGWAKQFLQSEAFGFIGTLWAISDYTAVEFTKELYKNLKEHVPLDEAVKIARLSAKEDGNPSWLAYSLYAPAKAVIKL